MRQYLEVAGSIRQQQRVWVETDGQLIVVVGRLVINGHHFRVVLPLALTVGDRMAKATGERRREALVFVAQIFDQNNTL